MKLNLSLKHSWTLIVLFAVITPVTIVMIWYGSTMYEFQLSSALKIEQQANELVKTKIESEIKRFKTLLKNNTNAFSHLLNQPSNTENLKEINTLLAAIIDREPSIHESMVLSTTANVIADVDPGMGILGDRLLSPEELQSVAIRAGFNEKYEIPEVVIPSLGRLYIGAPKRHDNKFSFTMASPIDSPVKAILVIIIDVDQLQPAHLNIDHEIGTEKSLNYMLDRRGTLVSEISNSDYKPGDLMTHLEITRTALINENWPTDISYIGTIKQPVFGTLTTIPSLNWTLISEVSTSKITQPIWDALSKIGLLTLLGIFIFIGIILRLINKTIKPIEQTCEAIDQVAKGDYKFTLKPSGIRELNSLTSGFNNMATARQDAETAIWVREQDLVTTLNSIGDAVITTDNKGNVTRMNPVAQALTGYSIDEALGRPIKGILKIINASTRETIANPVDKVLATGETVYLSNHTTLIAKDGNEYQIADSAAPIRDGNHEIQGMVLVFNDVTEQYHLREQTQLVQEKLQNKEKEQREILNSMVDTVISINENGVILSFNKAAEDLFGYEFNNIIGQKVNCLMPESFAHEHDSYIHNYIKTGNARVIGLGRDVEGLRKNGDVFPMRLLIAELPKDTDGKQRFIASCVDLTYIQQQEAQLRRSQKMDALGKLTGGIAHDYNNMLGVIMGYAELLENALNEQPKLEKYAHEIHHAGERGAKLTKKLLSFSSKQNAGAEMFNLNALLQDSQHMLEKTLTARIKLALDLSEDLWQVWLDSADMEDAIINLSINAMHAIEGSGQLTIRTSNKTLSSMDANLLNLKAGDYVLLDITDTGCGMDKNIKERVFEPFFTTKGVNGTGLGLSQVYGFVTRNFGTIKIYSEIGLGTRLSLYFPRHHTKETQKQPIIERSPTNLKGNETILLVDDEPALLSLTSDVLGLQGYKVICAPDGKQALEILATESIQLLLSDVIMPEMNGFQLAEIVQKKHPTVKIQLASGFTDNHHAETSDNSLHKNMLHKPYPANDLLSRVRNLLDEKPRPIDSNHTILVVDDEDDVQFLFEVNLKKLGYTVLTASNGEEAIELYKNKLGTNNPIDLMIVDLTIIGGIGGNEIANRTRNIHPNAKIIVVSGNLEAPEMKKPQDHNFDAAIEKNFDRNDIKHTLELVLQT